MPDVISDKMVFRFDLNALVVASNAREAAKLILEALRAGRLTCKITNQETNVAKEFNIRELEDVLGSNK